MWPRWGLGLLALVTLAVPARGQVTIEWKFKEGDKFYLHNTTTTKQVVEVLGQRTPMSSTQVVTSSFTVLKKTADGVVLRQQIEEQRAKAEGPTAAQQERAAELMKGTVFTFTLDNAGRITKVQGYEEMVKKLSEGNEEAAKGIRMVLNEDTLKQGVQEAFTCVPGKPVVKGDTWKSKMAMSMGPLGQFVADQQFTYTGPTKRGEGIGVKSTLRHEPPKDDGGGGLPFRVTKSNLTTKKGDGTIVFDTAKGRIASYDSTIHMNGTMTLNVNGQEAELKMDMETTIKLLWSDTMPKP